MHINIDDLIFALASAPKREPTTAEQIDRLEKQIKANQKTMCVYRHTFRHTLVRQAQQSNKYLRGQIQELEQKERMR